MKSNTIITKVAAGNNTGLGVAIAVPPDGLPVMAYGAVEAMNNNAKAISHRARGFRTAKTFKLAQIHGLGKLPLPESTHRFARGVAPSMRWPRLRLVAWRSLVVIFHAAADHLLRAACSATSFYCI